MKKRLIDMLAGGGYEDADGIDLYNRCYFKNVHPTVTTRTVNSNNYFIVKKMKINIPSELANRKGQRGRVKTCSVSEIVPYLPNETCFFDVRHLVVDIDILPFAVTTRINANDQQFLKKMNENTKTNVVEPSCPKIIGKPHGYYTGGEYEEYSPAVKSSSFPENNHLQTHDYRIRKLTPRECFRLMGVADNEIDKLVNGNISNAQLYKLAGNSIVVDVLYHIFRKMFVNRETEDGQLILNLI